MKKLVAAAFVTLLSTNAALAEWPERPIALIVPWSAGGSTDLIARKLASGLEKELGQPVNVVNIVGGSGVIGHQGMVSAAPDGYTLGTPSPDITTYYWTGMAEFNQTDITPLALLGVEPASFIVSESSKWTTLREALDDIKASPQGTYKMMGSPAGSGYHLAISTLFESQGIDPNRVVLVPTQGASASMQELAAGGIDFVFSSLAEGKGMIEAGRARGLAVLADKRNEAFPDIPTVEEAIGDPVAAGSWRGLIGPKGLPADIVGKIDAAAQRVVASDDFVDFYKKSGFGMGFLDAAGFAQFLDEQAERNGRLIKALGLSKRD